MLVIFSAHGAKLKKKDSSIDGEDHQQFWYQYFTISNHTTFLLPIKIFCRALRTSLVFILQILSTTRYVTGFIDNKIYLH